MKIAIIIPTLNERGSTDAEILGVMDADLSHPPELLIKMVENIKNYDIILPCRNMPGGGAEEWTFHRKLTSMLATDLIKLINIKDRDPLSGYFLFKKSVIDGVKLSPIGYKILLEILAKGNYKNFMEIPYIFRNRVVGTSKMSGRTIGQYLKHLWTLKQWQKKENRKINIFSSPPFVAKRWSQKRRAVRLIWMI